MVRVRDDREASIRICDFIRAEKDLLLADWEAFADELTPGERDLSREELRDFASRLLDSLCAALESEQLDPTRPPAEDAATKPASVAPDLADASAAHVSDRLMQRFTLNQMAAEYRGLRTSVTRRWLGNLETVGPAELDELSEFHRAVDLSLAVAVDWYDRRLRRAQEELQATDRAKDEFLATLGHELRNPLAPLRTGLDLLERARTKPELLDTLRPMMERQFAHLLRLVDDLLDIARISRGDIKLQAVPMDLNAAIEAAIEQVSPMIRERRHQLSAELSPAPIPVVGDFERLTEVVANVLSNACKYSEPACTITVVSAAAEGEAVVRVRDTGYGIPKARLDSIFDLFRQVPEHRAASGGGGLGIGLALSRRLMDLHGGTIEARSDGEGRGSEFIVKLPLSASLRAMSSEEDERDEAGPSRRVLVVEDNPDAADSLTLMITLMGHEVQTAYDGASAIEAFERSKPEVVLLDLGLPDIDGIEVARRIRAMSEGAGATLIALTGWSARTEYRQRAGEAEFDGYLIKPIDKDRIASILNPPPE